MRQSTFVLLCLITWAVAAWIIWDAGNDINHDVERFFPAESWAEIDRGTRQEGILFPARIER